MFNAEFTTERYWRGPRSQGREEEDYNSTPIATLSEFRSCVKVEVAACRGLSVLMSLTVPVDVKQH